MRTILFSLLFLAFCACVSDEEKAARQLLEEVRESISTERYDRALTLLDSLNKTYPSLVNERKDALSLKQEVRQLQSKRDSLFLIPLVDSLLIMEKRIDLAFEEVRDEVVKDYAIRRYKGYDPTDAPRTPYLDVYFNNNGGLEIVASFCAQRPVGIHTTLIRSLKSDTYVISDSIPHTSGLYHRYETDGLTYERLTYTEDNADRLAAFVAGMGADAQLQVELLGDSPKAVTFRLTPQAIKAIQSSYERHRIQSDLLDAQTQLERHHKRAERRNISPSAR